MYQTWENGKKPKSVPNFGLFDPNLDPKNFLAGFTSTNRSRHCSKLSPYAI